MFFFFNDTATTEIYPLSLHDALPIYTTEDGPIPVLGYLAAAYAAQQQGRLENRDQYLAKAGEADLAGSLAVGLTRARLQMNAQQWQEALATLQSLKSQQPRHPRVLQYLLEVYQALSDWRPLLETLANEIGRASCRERV